MYWQTHVNHKPYKLTTVTSVCISSIISGQFTKLYHHFPQHLFIDFELNFRAGTKVCWQSLCLLKDVKFLACYFMKPLYCFYLMVYYDSLWCRHIWFIDTIDTQTKGFFLNKPQMVTELLMFCRTKGFDIVSASEMNCNRTVSTQQPAYLIWTGYT